MLLLCFSSFWHVSFEFKTPTISCFICWSTFFSSMFSTISCLWWLSNSLSRVLYISPSCLKKIKTKQKESLKFSYDIIEKGNYKITIKMATNNPNDCLLPGFSFSSFPKTSPPIWPSNIIQNFHSWEEVEITFKRSEISWRSLHN